VGSCGNWRHIGSACGGRSGRRPGRGGDGLGPSGTRSGRLPGPEPRQWAQQWWDLVGSGDRKRESADKPGSVESNHPSGTHVAMCLKRPTRKPLRAAGTNPLVRALPYLVLLQVGFAVPPSVATGAVRSYRTLSPLPATARCSRHLGRTFVRPAPSQRAATSAVCFLLHFPWARAPQALPGTSPCGARTFLCKIRSGCLADSRVNDTACASLAGGFGARQRKFIEFVAPAPRNARRQLCGLGNR